MNRLSMGKHLLKENEKEKDFVLDTFFCDCRLQLLLLSDIERVRAASLRALRYSIHRITIFDKFLESRLDYLVCR